MVTNDVTKATVDMTTQNLDLFFSKKNIFVKILFGYHDN